MCYCFDFQVFLLFLGKNHKHFIMKNIVYYLFLSFLCFASISCSNDETNTKEPLEVSVNLEKMTREYNARQHRNIPAEYFENHVDFGLSEQNLVLLVGNPGNYKTSFRIQMNEDYIKDLKSIQAGDFKIGYFGRDLVLINGKDIYYFTVDEEPNFKEIASNSNLFKVIGITNWKNVQLKSSSKAMAFNLVDEGASCTCEPVLENQVPCKSGGTGSDACSQGDCSVTCSEGFYACCNE